MFCIMISHPEEKMPTRRLRPTKTEDHEFRTRLSRLDSLGIPIGDTIDSMPAPNRLTMQQINDGVSRIHQLPWDRVVVVLSASMVIFKAGLLIVDCRIMTS